MRPAEAKDIAAYGFERVQLPEEWRCEVCDHNRVVFLLNAERLLCAVCSGARIAERILPIGSLTNQDAAAWLQRHPTGANGERAVLMGQRFFTPGLERLTAKDDLAGLRAGEFAFLEIWQEPAWRG